MTDNNLARAYWVQEPGKGQIVATQLVDPGPDEVMVKALFSGISRGSESLVFMGNVPPSEYQTMRAPFQEGNFPGPVKYGYSNVGRIEKGPSELLGQIVFCLYPHQDRYVVPIQSVLSVPPNVPQARAVLAANMETAINGLWDAPVMIGANIIVVGAGVIGCLVAFLAGQIPGTHVMLVDTNTGKAKIANALGIEFAEPGAAIGLGDLVIHATGSSEGLKTALGLAGAEATVLELSWFGNHDVSVPLGEAFHSKRLRLQSSQVGMVGVAQRTRWNSRRRLSLALDLLSDDVLDNLITGQSEFETLPATMQRLAATAKGELCHRIVYPDVANNKLGLGESA